MDPLGDTDFHSDYDEEDLMKLAFLNEITSKLPKKLSVKPDHFTLWSDDEFHFRFRLLKSTVRFVVTLIEVHIACPEEWDIDISPEQQFLFTLRYFAMGTVTAACQDFIGISKFIGKQIIGRVCDVLALLRSRLIHFPKCPIEIKKVEQEFFNVGKLPRCIGVIGCTHVKFAVMNEPKSEMYKNENDFYSLKVQIVCDTNSKIENIVARWPGSIRDSTIFARSKLQKQFEDGEMGNRFILADYSYPLRKYLLTPFADPVSAAETKYNEALIRTRVHFTATCLQWKRRFPILIIGIPGNSDWVQCVTVATAILHNVACNIGEKTPKITEDEQNALELTQISDKRSYVNEADPHHSAVRNILVEYLSKLH